ncbi:hypothetical protein KJY77_06485, partial [Canibacter sp. lx-72]|uniref:hypothetical protein n=1 Tax=Canibacter zhuwentaonis TaxID=2837491 RepID=UPI001BDC1472
MEVVLTGVVSLLLQARGVVSNILTLVLVFSTLASAQTGQTVGVGVATGQNTMLQVAGDKPVKPTTTTTSLPGNTGANVPGLAFQDVSGVKPETSVEGLTDSRWRAPAKRNVSLEGLVKTETVVGKTEYHPGEKASITVYTRYDETKYDVLKQVSQENHYTVTVNVAVTLPQGFEISPEALTRGVFTQDCTGAGRLQCQLSGFTTQYDPRSRVLRASYQVFHNSFDGAQSLFEIITIPGTATGVIGSHTVTTTANGVIEFPIGKLGGVAHSESFTATPSQAMFTIVSRKTVLKASFTPVGLTEGQVIVRGDVVCTFPGSQPSRKTLMFTLKYNELANGRWERELHNMVDVGSNCT